MAKKKEDRVRKEENQKTSKKKSTTKKNNQVRAARTVKNDVKVEKKVAKETKTKKSDRISKKEPKYVPNASSFNNEGIKYLKVIVSVLACFLVFWGITYLVTEKREKTSEGDSSSSEKLATIQYDKILVGTMLNQKRSEYYVLLDKIQDDSFRDYGSYTSLYEEKEDALKIYLVDMEDPFNKMYYGEDSNITSSELSDFKIKDVTLLKIQDSEIVETYEGKEEVLDQLKDMTK